MITLFHGATTIVERPLCGIGRSRLDFGPGFYVTDLQAQATDWSLLVANKRNEVAIVNSYQFDKEGYLSESRAKIFTDYDEEWLEFIVANRHGRYPQPPYDYTEGGNANDRVIDTVRLYSLGLLTLREALFRLKLHKPNNQICLNNQELIDKYLRFHEARRI